MRGLSREQAQMWSFIMSLLMVKRKSLPLMTNRPSAGQKELGEVPSRGLDICLGCVLRWEEETLAHRLRGEHEERTTSPAQ